MNSSLLLKAFNKHFREFLEDIQIVFPDDEDVRSTKNALLALQKANPKILIRVWSEYIVEKYRDQIKSNDLSFFIEKSYLCDMDNMDNARIILDKIELLRDIVRRMSKLNQDKIMAYIINFTKISDLYNELSLI